MCKDQFWIEPRTGIDPAPKSPNNKFVESGRKSQSGSRVQILVDSVKWKELQMHTCKKHPRTCPNSMIDNEEFFRFTVAFLQPFALFSFLCFFSLSPFFESLFVLYTMVFSQFSPSTCESDVESFPVPSRPPLNFLLLTVRLLVYYSDITSTLMRPESQLDSI